MCARPSVIDIAEYVQLVDAEFLDDLAHGDDKGIGLSGGNDCLDNAVEIVLLVIFAAFLVEEFLDYICKFFREGFADF